MSGLWFEDFAIGRRFETEPVTLEVDEITWFARQYDPQPFHTDARTAEDTVFGGLIASGFQTVAISTGQFIRTGALDGTGMGGPGLDEIRWIAPVRPGDTLHTSVEVAEARPTRSDPGRGVVRLAFNVSTDAGEVATFTATVFLRRRPE
jgi:acyl dehydratase